MTGEEEKKEKREDLDGHQVAVDDDTAGHLLVPDEFGSVVALALGGLCIRRKNNY